MSVVSWLIKKLIKREVKKVQSNKPKWVAWIIWALTMLIEALKEMPTEAMGLTTGVFNVVQGNFDRGKDLKPPEQSIKNWSTLLTMAYQVYMVVAQGGSPWGLAITLGLWGIARLRQRM